MAFKQENNSSPNDPGEGQLAKSLVGDSQSSTPMFNPDLSIEFAVIIGLALAPIDDIVHINRDANILDVMLSRGIAILVRLAHLDDRVFVVFFVCVVCRTSIFVGIGLDIQAVGAMGTPVVWVILGGVGILAAVGLGQVFALLCPVVPKDRDV